MSDKPAKKRLPKPPLGKSPLTLTYLSERFFVCQQTGKILHKVRKLPSATSKQKRSRAGISSFNKRKAGQVASVVTKGGAIRVPINVKGRILSYCADELAYVLQAGPIPSGKAIRVKDPDVIDFRIDSMELYDTASEEIGGLLDEQDPLRDMKRDA